MIDSYIVIKSRSVAAPSRPTENWQKEQQHLWHNFGRTSIMGYKYK